MNLTEHQKHLYCTVYEMTIDKLVRFGPSTQGEAKAWLADVHVQKQLTSESWMQSTRYVAAQFWRGHSDPGLSLSLQELVVDVAVAMSFRHVDLSRARHFDVASPRFLGCRLASTVRSQDCLGRPILRLKSSGGPMMQACRAR